MDGPTLPPERSDPDRATRPVREYLAALDAAAARVAGEVDGEEQHERPAIEPAPARSLPLTDPAAAWTSKGAHKAIFAYPVNWPALDGGFGVRGNPSGSGPLVCLTDLAGGSGRWGHAKPLTRPSSTGSRIQ